jgi:hypothetical protein
VITWGSCQAEMVKGKLHQQQPKTWHLVFLFITLYFSALGVINLLSGEAVGAHPLCFCWCLLPY